VKSVRVLRKVKVDRQWKLLPVAKTGPRFDWAYVKLRGERLPAGAGAFYLEYIEHGRKVRRLVGATPKDAQAAMLNQAQVLELRSRGVEVQDAPEIQTRRDVHGKTIAEVVNKFTTHPPAGLRPRSVTKYTFDLEQFAAWARGRGITHLCQLEREHLCAYISHLVRVEELAMKSAVNKTVIALKLLRDAGAVIVMKKGDWPKVTQQRPEIYTPEQLEPLFAGMNRTERALYQTFLMTGFRDQELGYATRSDFNAADGTLSVTKKAFTRASASPAACNAFDPKTYRERTVEIPPQLVKILEAHVARMEDKNENGTLGSDDLLFPTSGGKRDKHMLRKLKRIALRQGLNCGRCESVVQGKPASCRTAPICRRWTLHKFRHTYATTLIRDGWDVVTVQHMLGHAELESTLIYVHGLPSEERRRKMASTSLTTKFLSLHRPQLQQTPALSSEAGAQRVRSMQWSGLQAQGRAAGRAGDSPRVRPRLRHGALRRRRAGSPAGVRLQRPQRS
jgi:site-specific recombinase XerD